MRNLHALTFTIFVTMEKNASDIFWYKQHKFSWETFLQEILFPKYQHVFVKFRTQYLTP